MHNNHNTNSALEEHLYCSIALKRLKNTRHQNYVMRDKRAITPVIAVILLIVMTVGIAAFTFVWMQNFVQSLQTQTQERIHQLQQIPQFKISYAVYDKNNDNLTFIIANVGDVPIDTKELKVTIEGYKKIDGSFNGVITTNAIFTCSPNIIKPFGDAICWKQLSGIDLDNNYYQIIVSYKGATAQYTLGR